MSVKSSAPASCAQAARTSTLPTVFGSVAVGWWIVEGNLPRDAQADLRLDPNAFGAEVLCLELGNLATDSADLLHLSSVEETHTYIGHADFLLRKGVITEARRRQDDRADVHLDGAERKKSAGQCAVDMGPTRCVDGSQFGCRAQSQTEIHPCMETAHRVATV